MLYSTQPAAVLLQPGRPDKPSPTSPRATPEISDGRQDRHGQDQDGRQVRAAGRPRGHVQGRQVRDRARASAPTSPTATRPPTSATSSAPRRADQGRHSTIAGIETPDDQTLVFKLKRPVGGVLAAAPRDADHRSGAGGVREEVRRQEPVDLRREQVAFTGPYMIKNDAAGKAIGYEPGKRIELVRNPNWDKSLDFRPAYLDSITIEEGNDDPTVASRRTLNGQSLIYGDSDRRRRRSSRRRSKSNKDQLEFVAGGGTRWIALNTRQKPFDNINVRKAVIAGFDRNAALLDARRRADRRHRRRTSSRRASPASRSRAAWRVRGLDYLAKPEGDPALSAEYFKKAGYASGKYEGTEEILMIATRTRIRAQKVAEVAQEQVREAGLQAPAAAGPAGHAVHEVLRRPEGRLRDLPERRLVQGLQRPAVAARPDVQGDAHQAAEQRQLDRARRPGDRRRHDQGGGRCRSRRSATRRGPTINKKIMEQAPAVPYVWEKAPLLRPGTSTGSPTLYLGHGTSRSRP